MRIDWYGHQNISADFCVQELGRLKRTPNSPSKPSGALMSMMRAV
jgi:hypothetical protein